MKYEGKIKENIVKVNLLSVTLHPLRVVSSQQPRALTQIKQTRKLILFIIEQEQPVSHCILK